jgi:hypothetical protein
MKRAKTLNECALPAKYFSAQRSGELARFVTFSDGSLAWDAEKLSVSLSEEEKEDALLLVNIFTGRIITSRVLPLLFSHGPRSLDFYARAAKEPRLVQELSEADRVVFNVGLRDLYVACSKDLLSAAEVNVFRAVVAIVEEPQPLLEVQGLCLSYYPTQSKRLVRFAEMDGDAEQLLAEIGGCKMCFADPGELNFRTFENIIPLDRAFAGARLKLTLGKAEAMTKDASIVRLCLGGESVETLLELDRLGLYVAPLNSAARGGTRFIFSSAALAATLTEALRKAAIKGITDSKQFVSVNSVFRMNRFEEGARKFDEHMDAPYYDAAKRHRSRYTVIVYLTGGSGAKGEPVLSFENGVAIAKMEAMTVVVFDQSLRHAGNAYEAGPKLFLRSELIFEQSEREATMSDASIGALFSRAVYLTKEAAVASSPVFGPEVAGVEHDHYNTVSAAHFGKADAKAVAPVYFHKQFDGAHFLSNGYDYFFHAKRSGWDLHCCAAVVLLDYFNAKVGGKSFAKLSKAKRATALKKDTLLDVFVFLDGQKYKWDESSRVIGRTTAEAREAMLPPLLPELREKHYGSEELPPEVEAIPEGKCCCAFHYQSAENIAEYGDEDDQPWNPELCSFTVNRFNSAVSFARQMLAGAPLFIMGDEVKLSYENVIIRGNQIHVLSQRQMQPVNFAACWNGVAINNLIGASEVESAHALYPVVPPLIFSQLSNGLVHICLDFFRNEWMIGPSKQLSIPIPKFEDEDEKIGEDAPFEDSWYGAVGWKEDDDNWKDIFDSEDFAVRTTDLIANAPVADLEGSIRAAPKVRLSKFLPRKIS